MHTAVASSPLSVGSRGSSSFKRTNSRGSTGVPPRPAAAGSATYTGSLSGLAEQGVPASMLWTLSGSARRNVSSSPTTGAPDAAEARISALAAVTVLGFAPACQQQQQQQQREAQAAQLPCSSPPPPAAAPRPSKGLLSRALTTEVESSRASTPAPPQQDAQASLYGALGRSSQGACWAYPDVDRTLLQDLQERHPVFHSELVSMAYMLAAKAHAGQLRKDGTSQLSHGVMTALQLAELGLDAETVAAGLLHEVLRSNPSFRSQMEEFMPSSVIDLVDRVTTISEISQLYRHNKDALGEEKMRRLLLAMEDVKAMLVKLACRVHNMKTLGALPRETQVALAQETLDIFSVVANRLGVWSLKAELEDLAFSVLHPEEYQALKAQVSKRQNPEALEATIHRIKESLDASGVRYEDISGRPKNLYGIWCKMRANPDIASLDQIYDLTALRVVVTNKHDCYRALRCLLEVYRTMPGRSKDYIKGEKKPNGYQSLHETIYGEDDMPMEVQIRTHKMHYIAEYGFAAHWKYKEKLSNEDEWLDKEVQYKKWLTTYKLNLHDKKVRAAGALPRETALDSLGMHLIDAAAPLRAQRSQHQQQRQGRQQPELQHPAAASAPSVMQGARGAAAQAHGVTAVDPFLQHDRFRLQAPAKHKVDVVLQTQDSIDLRDFPAGFTVASLARELQVDQLPGYVVLVNKRVPTAAQELRSGDLVQVVPQPSPQPSPRVVATSAPSSARSPLASMVAVGGASAQQQQQVSGTSTGRPPLSGGSNNVVPLSLSSRRRASNSSGVAALAAARAMAAGVAAAEAAVPPPPALPPSVLCV